MTTKEKAQFIQELGVVYIDTVLEGMTDNATDEETDSFISVCNKVERLLKAQWNEIVAIPKLFERLEESGISITELRLHRELLKNGLVLFSSAQTDSFIFEPQEYWFYFSSMESFCKFVLFALDMAPEEC